jgi:hypothetical protein
MEFISMRFFFRQRFNKKLKETDNKPLYEKIFNHEDSIYFVEARKTSGNCRY